MSLKVRVRQENYEKMRGRKGKMRVGKITGKVKIIQGKIR